MEVKLVVAEGSKAGQEIPITVPKFLIGRADDCHLKPRSELISRYHCAVICEPDYIAVRDLGSKNGVFLNGEKVSVEHELKNGDKLTIGPLEFFAHVNVAVKAPKKPKVENISEAVNRTVELSTGSTPEDQKETEITDWLLSSDESGNEQETQTVAQDDVLATIEAQQKEMQKKEQEQKAETPEPSYKKPQDATSRDAAANLLKNFFKGGR
ncbi:MAG: FHA domain-containing protein [Planctomycetaceae bacterium]|nr:FHA domain-containing protein [Planctomycetaceae bacterium]